MAQLALDAEVQSHLMLVPQNSVIDTDSRDQARFEEIRTTPLFSSDVHAIIKRPTRDVPSTDDSTEQILPQYALLGIRSATYGGENDEDHTNDREENLVYANINALWSTFICGSQGSGKAIHCRTGAIAPPLTGLVLHYGKFTGIETGQWCEAAYLCSSGIPVDILVSPSNYVHMNKLYSELPGLSTSAPKPNVYSMFFREEHLSVGMMKNFMVVSGGDGGTPQRNAIWPGGTIAA
ncbi:hypothetical protein P152DRAFT_513838 [Eremomyces bilateralis CBS 781.70]|uniref:Uncharacterized protein n=1 Tax=Eremomyces bilateralis CBS 781.70 TaxID=1392243 RepID=A0A6G1G4N8_9PEZI|nr:uncharacterized protein P152DRAFT_513838 [Eremomyces bilateralis CBS 781.70]KAF1812799.1 hypothetical protein P152DRAFT_513838 [Eremomyces bilateralis CBS 781.70]